MRIEPGDRIRSAVDLFSAQVTLAMQNLPLQVGERHDVVVSDADRANAGRREILDKRRTEPAGADDKHARSFQLQLAGPPTSCSTMCRAYLSISSGFERHGGLSTRERSPNPEPSPRRSSPQKNSPSDVTKEGAPNMPDSLRFLDAGFQRGLDLVGSCAVQEVGRQAQFAEN